MLPPPVPPILSPSFWAITSIQPVLFSSGTTASVPASPSMVRVALRNTPPRAAKEILGQPLRPSAR